MFGWIHRCFSPAERRGGPLGSPRAVRALIAQLDGQPPQLVLRTVAQRFVALSDALNGADPARAFMRLDEYAQRAVAELWESLLSGPRGVTIAEDEWGILASYHRGLHAAYWCYLQHHTRAASEQEHADAIVTAARAMAALAKYMLLLRMRYRQSDREVWLQVKNLVDWAEKRGQLGAEMELYPGVGSHTSIQGELLSALMIEATTTSNLIPAQMRALERLLRLHAAGFRMSADYDERATPFAYDASSGKPPQRWFKELPVRPGMQFFGPGDAYVELCAARDTATSSSQLPQWLAATRCGGDDYRDLLVRLAEAWSLQPPLRRYRREPCEGEILVAHEWSEIRRLVKFSELARAGRFHGYESTNIYGIHSTPRAPMERDTRNPQTEQPAAAPGPLANLLSFENFLNDDVTETWTLTNASEVGLGATAAARTAWAKVGMMVAFRHADSVDWQLALIRRLNRSDAGLLTIGMTRLCQSVRSARLRLGAGGRDYHPAIGGNDPTTVEYDALVASDAAGTIFVPPGTFDRSWKYTLYRDNRQEIVKMEKSIERGLNFECVEVSAVEAARAA